MELHITLDGGDLATAMYDQIRAAIVAGRLLPGERLPSTRELAGRLAVSRTTVGVAFDRLLAEGFVTSRVGAGTFVGADVPAPRPDGGVPVASPLRPRPVWDRIGDAPVPGDLRPELDLRTGVPDASCFPYGTWRALLAEQMRPSAVGRGDHVDAAGVGALRGALARHVGVSRGVVASAEDVFVTSGSQQAVDLVTRVLVEPGDTVAVEDPGYLPVVKAFVAHGARVVGVPVDAEGIVTGALPRAARLVYVTPSHQYPLGVAMSLRRRLDLLGWADRVGAAVVEDDYDSEYRYGGRPLEPLHALDRTGRVLYVGSLSKVLLPTLRLGFLVAPAPLHGALRKAKHVADWHTAVPMQAAAARFVAEGHLARHVRRTRTVYAERHRLLCAALADGPLAPHLEGIPSVAGLHVAAFLRGGGEDTAAVARALARGVAVQPLSRYRTAPGRPGLMLGFGAVPTARIGEAVRRLAEVLRG